MVIKSVPKSIRAKSKRKKYVSPRKRLEAKLESLVRKIVFWRDQNVCVEAEIDGARCNGVPQWGHVIGRHASPWLKYDLMNSTVQCACHNRLHHYGDPTMFLWYSKTLGAKRLTALMLTAKEHIGIVRTEAELQDMIDRYTELWENRPALFDVKTLITRGYFG